MMNHPQKDPVTITDVTLREFGQNVPAESLPVFTPEVRVDMARRLADSGFRNMEVFSCVNPRVAPAMNREHIARIAAGLGRIEDVNIITAVPNRAGYENFLSLGLGRDGYNHILGVFFSAVEAHNLANLGRTIKETLQEYEAVLKDAAARGIRVAAYVSGAFGYRLPEGGEVLRPTPQEINAHIDWYLELGAETVTLSDLQGVSDDKQTTIFFEALMDGRGEGDLALLGYHPHHVSGEEAVANSMAAYEIGIRRFDASLGGTGGCVTGAPGNQPTELLVKTFHAGGVSTGIDEGKVRSLALLARTALYDKIPMK
ncbi:MAG: hypothetical protein JRK53_20050 [Deltaproteobacteria bacterium]|nr:hypothetical protein [Deltaproteobacteria bacterium]